MGETFAKNIQGLSCRQRLAAVLTAIDALTEMGGDDEGQYIRASQAIWPSNPSDR